MPFALIIALAASLGIHVAALFGPDIELATEPESMPVMVELKPMPRPQAPVEPPKKSEKPTAVKAKAKQPRQKAAAVAKTVAIATPVLSVPEASSDTVAAPTVDAAGKQASVVAPEPALLPAVAPRLPEHGRISYRVDRGDSNFEIGVSRHEWSVFDGHYRLSSVVETTGLVWLFKSYRIEMESRGLMTAEGLQPESFAIRRNGQEVKEKALFDWENMTVRVGDHGEQALDYGAQDLLSFNYQLGFLPHPEAGSTLPIATGRKYGIYRLEVLGDEEIEVPAGVMRTLHLRAPGENTTELWLAYDYLLLPVKIRYVDSKGDSLVQVATKIQLSPE
ncbi:DUF3108 domain-containing protein [Propionivibrio sp.]|uniref:DUF3108 domain-containing protein n=1 Tax=Propionivibrio sp. TaxID=2212460 RepID=UPI003BF06FC2